jgi:O-acetyl-ADP-ribose deacetylase
VAVVTRIEFALGDITRQPDCDAIVNAANTALAAGGGVCGAIHRAGGAEIARECVLVAPCATGDARITTGGRLPNRFVIHAVGPVWHGGGHGEARALAACHRRAVEVAAEHGCRSLAFPAVSTGIYGYPVEQAATVAVTAVTEAARRVGLTLARFVLFSDADLAVYRAAALAGGDAYAPT